MYATAQDIIERYGLDELLVIADRDRDGQPDSALVEQALADASSLIDGYLTPRYTLPLPGPTPKILTACCIDLAMYALSPIANPNEERRNRNNDALKLLGKIGSGEVQLGSGVQQSTTAPSGAFFTCRPPVFRRGL